MSNQNAATSLPAMVGGPFTPIPPTGAATATVAMDTFMMTPIISSSKTNRPEPVGGRPMTIYARVKSKSVNGGMDTKYVTGDYPTGLHALIPYEVLETLIEEVNAARAEFRSTRADGALLALGAVTGFLTLAPFVMRKKKRAGKRKKATNEIFKAFNNTWPKLRARITENGDLIIEDNPATLYTGPRGQAIEVR